jgi:hypothetical protein
MPGGRKTTEELIAEEEKKAEQVKTRMAELKSRQRSEDRKRDNHRKIVVGAAAMAHIRIDPQFRKALRDALTKAVTDPKQRAVIPDLLDEQAFLEAMRAAATKAAAEASEAAVAAGAETLKESAVAKATTEGTPKQPTAEKRPPQQVKSGPAA